jgi:hypothetical protein
MGIDIEGGDGGGEGVVDVERKVGPRSSESGFNGECRVRSRCVGPTG